MLFIALAAATATTAFLPRALRTFFLPRALRAFAAALRRTLWASHRLGRRAAGARRRSAALDARFSVCPLIEPVGSLRSAALDARFSVCALIEPVGSLLPAAIDARLSIHARIEPLGSLLPAAPDPCFPVDTDASERG